VLVIVERKMTHFFLDGEIYSLTRYLLMG